MAATDDLRSAAESALSDLDVDPLLQAIYREPLPRLPTDSDPGRLYTPRPFDGPRGKAERFHSFPRLGYTNDIASLTKFGSSDDDQDQEQILPYEMLSGLNSLVDPGETAVEPPALSTKSYSSQDANDYVRGIASAGILILCIYVLWATWLLLLRLGRMDCCFRLCKGRDKKKGASNAADDINSTSHIPWGEEDEASRECACVTCYDSLAAKGGCCTRHVFCGWMAGRPPKMPTRTGLEKEEWLKQNGFGSAVRSAKGGLAALTGSNPNVEAETGVPAAEDSTSKVDEEYVTKRQRSARRTMLALRVTFLTSALLVVAFGIVLLVEGWRGINGVVDSSKGTLSLMEGQVDEMMDRVDEYLTSSAGMREARAQFFERLQSQVDVEDQFEWCPSRGADGQIEVSVSLGDLLLRGNLIKLAFVDDDEADDGRMLQEGAMETLQGTAEGVKEMAAETVQGAVEGAKETVVETVQGVVEGAKETVAETVQGAAEGVTETVENVVGTAKRKAVTVVTFLDQFDGDGDGLLGKVLGLKDELSGEGLGANGRIVQLVERIRAKVKSVVSRVSNRLDSEPSRHLQSSIRESLIIKDGQEYTILETVGELGNPVDFVGDELVVRGYNLTELLRTEITLTINIPPLVTTVRERLESLSDILTDRFTTLRGGLVRAKAQAASAQETLDSILPYYIVAVVFVSILMFVTLLLSAGVVLAWTKRSHRLFMTAQDWVLCPILIVCGLLAWIFTVVFLSLGVVSGDFCVNSPDVQMSKILEQMLKGTSSVAYNFAYYYVNSCPAEFKPTLIERTAEALSAARGGVGQFFALFSNLGAGPLSMACGINALSTIDGVDNPFEVMKILAGNIRQQIVLSTKAVFGLADLLLCQNFSLLYTSLTHDLVCTEFVNMISPMLWSLFLISIFSMVMVTLRVAWHEFVPDGVLDEEGMQIGNDLHLEEDNPDNDKDNQPDAREDNSVDES